MSYRALSTQQRSTGTAFTGAPPAGTVSGDDLYAWIYRDSTSAITPDTGWTLLQSPNLTASSGRLYWKRATGSEPANYNFTWTGSVFYEGYIVRVDGTTGTGDPTDTSTSGTVTVASFTSPALAITLASGDVTVLYFSSNEGTNVVADVFSDGTYTVVAGGSAGTNTGIAYKDAPSAGSTGSLSFSWGNNDASQSVGCLVGIAATSSGGATDTLWAQSLM